MQAKKIEPRPDIIQDKIGIFEKTKNAKVCNDADYQKHFPPHRIFNSFQADANEIVDERGQQNQKAARNAPTHVEYITGQQQEPFLVAKVSQTTPDEQDCREKEDVFEGSENHGCA